MQINIKYFLMEAYIMLSQINKVILKSLENGDKYGLEIIKDIEDVTNGKVIIKQPTLYSSLRRMEKRGYISSFWQDSAIGGRRHYYSLTNLGKEEIKNAASVLSEEEINDLLEEVNKSRETLANLNAELEAKQAQEEKYRNIDIETEAVLKSNEAFEKFDPSSVNMTKNSFTQEMRQYVEPEGIEDLTEKEENPFIKEEKEESNLFDKESDITIVREEPKSRDEINYKDILGELDASNGFIERQYFEDEKKDFQQEKVTLQQKSEFRKSQHLKEVEQILTSRSPTQNATSKPIETNKKITQNKDFKTSLDEISKRYDNKQQNSTSSSDYTVPSNTTGYKHIRQENIVIKQYNKADTLPTNTKNFLNINKFNFCRGMIMSLLYIIEVLVAYFVIQSQGLFYEPHGFLYWVALGLVSVYMIVTILISFQDINKKVRISEINWVMNFFYRLLFAVVILTFVISVCLCFGMNGFMDMEFFTIWFLFAIAVVNIVLSWFVGRIIFATKAFRE